MMFGKKPKTNNPRQTNLYKQMSAKKLGANCPGRVHKNDTSAVEWRRIVLARKVSRFCLDLSLLVEPVRRLPRFANRLHHVGFR